MLFMDELKSESLPFELLLTIMQGYRTQIHCRYANCFALWSEVHITSIFCPEDIYNEMVKRESQAKDTIKQLLRRITRYVYHYTDGDTYRVFELSGEKYKGYENLIALATGNDGFIKVGDGEVPF